MCKINIYICLYLYKDFWSLFILLDQNLLYNLAFLPPLSSTPWKFIQIIFYSSNSLLAVA